MQQGGHGGLDRHAGVGPVDQIKVNIVGAQIAQRGVAFPKNGGRLAAADIFAVDELCTALGDDVNLVANAHVLHDTAYIVLSNAVVVGGSSVDEIDTLSEKIKDLLKSID